jgi:predicted O-methyltransferase YrrM
MIEPQWNAVDQYITDHLLENDPTMTATLAANAAAGLPAHDVSPAQGKLLHLLARMIGARRILEIGTLGGYSTIWFARALPAGGRVITLEANPRHATTACENVARAGLTDRVEVRIGLALETLPLIHAEQIGPFDIVFIDADKPNNPAYLAWAIRLARPGTVIIADNVVRDGTIVDPDSGDPSIQGTRRFFDMLGHERRLSATAIQTVGCKGWDGFMLAVVN